jgi:hypothetical protein
MSPFELKPVATIMTKVLDLIILSSLSTIFMAMAMR